MSGSLVFSCRLIVYAVPAIKIQARHYRISVSQDELIENALFYFLLIENLVHIMFFSLLYYTPHRVKMDANPSHIILIWFTT